MHKRRLLLPLLLVAALLGGLSTPVSAAEPGFNTPASIPPNDFPDPFVLKDGATFFAYGTDGDLGNVQVLSSPDLATWSKAGSGNALAQVPAGFQNDDVWAPAVLRTATSYVLYAAAVRSATGKRCIIAATSANDPTSFGGAKQVVCNDAEGGVIDPDVFTTLGGTYLLWKTEGVPGSVPPALWSQQLGPDGTTVLGSPSRLLSSRYPWEGTLIENPTMVAAVGRTFLFYSGNEWESPAYGVGWAVCDGPSGPCVAPPGKPLLTTEGPAMRGPGGGTVFQVGDQWWLGYAAWIDGNTTEASGQRKLFFRKLAFVNGRPALYGPNGQPAPQNVAERVAGANRYDTAAAFSAKTVQGTRPVTYVATGAAFPDALASGPASGLEGSPVLLVEPGRVPESVRSELARLRPGHIVVMGGTGAISDDVYNQLGQYSNGSIHREPGTNRYDTAARVSKNTYRNGAPVAYVATGENFADALAGGAAGARNRGPLLLVTRDGIPAETGAELARLKPGRIVVLGGTGAVSDGVAGQLGQYGPVTRIAGNNRYDTAARVAQQEFSGTIGGVVVATGQSFPDAVAAGAAGFPVLLVPSGGAAPAEVKAALQKLNPLGILVMGGQGAVPDDTLASILCCRS